MNNFNNLSNNLKKLYKNNPVIDNDSNDDIDDNDNDSDDIQKSTFGTFVKDATLIGASLLK